MGILYMSATYKAMTFKFLTQIDSGLPLLSNEKYLPVVDVTVIVTSRKGNIRHEI